MYLTIFLCLLLPSDGRVPGQNESGSRKGENAGLAVDPVYLVAKCRKMNDSEYMAFVKGLGKKHDFASLEVLYTARFDHGCAAWIACDNMPDEKVVNFCRQFEEGSENWESAFSGLSSHPTRAVRDYVKEVAKSRKFYRLISCYRLCSVAHWDDLLEEAKRDSTVTTEKIPVDLSKRTHRHEGKLG